MRFDPRSTIFRRPQEDSAAGSAASSLWPSRSSASDAQPSRSTSPSAANCNRHDRW